MPLRIASDMRVEHLFQRIALGLELGARHHARRWPATMRVWSLPIASSFAWRIDASAQPAAFVPVRSPDRAAATRHRPPPARWTRGNARRCRRRCAARAGSRTRCVSPPNFSSLPAEIEHSRWARASLARRLEVAVFRRARTGRRPCAARLGVRDDRRAGPAEHLVAAGLVGVPVRVDDRAHLARRWPATSGCDCSASTWRRRAAVDQQQALVAVQREHIAAHAR